MSDVYKIQTSMNLAGTLAPEMRKMLRTMTDVEHKAKDIEKATAGWRSPIAYAAAGLQQTALAAAKVAGEVRSVSRGLQTTQGVARSLGGTFHTWSGGLRSAVAQANALANALTRAQRAGASAARSSRTHGTAAGAVLGLPSTNEAIRATATSAGERQRETIREKNAGLTEVERKRLDAFAMSEAGKYPSLSATKIREMGRLVIPNVANFEKAMNVMPAYTRGLAAVQTLAGPEGAAEEMEKFSRYVDIIGKSMDTGATKELLDGYLKARQLDSGALSANDYVNMAQGAGAPGKSFGLQFWKEVAPALIAQQKGSRTGVDLASAYQNTVIGRGTDESLMAQAALGLRVGTAYGFKRSGKKELYEKGTLVDQSLFGENPYEWAKKHLIPRLAERGIVPKSWLSGTYSEDLTPAQRVELSKTLSSAFSNRRGANIFDMIIGDIEQNEAFIKRHRNAKGVADVDKDQKTDPFVAWSAFTTQVKDFAGALMDPAVKGATGVLHDMAVGLAGWSKSVLDFHEKVGKYLKAIFGEPQAFKDNQEVNRDLNGQKKDPLEYLRSPKGGDAPRAPLLPKSGFFGGDGFSTGGVVRLWNNLFGIGSAAQAAEPPLDRTKRTLEETAPAADAAAGAFGGMYSPINLSRDAASTAAPAFQGLRDPVSSAGSAASGAAPAMLRLAIGIRALIEAAGGGGGDGAGAGGLIQKASLGGGGGAASTGGHAVAGGHRHASLPPVGLGDPGSGARGLSNSAGLNNDFAARLKAMQDAAPPGAFNVSSGYRSVERQRQLYAAAVRKYGSGARRWVAPPGHSRHNHGTAADLSFGPGGRSWVHRNAHRFGLHFPMRHEPWHIEPRGSRRSFAPPPRAPEKKNEVIQVNLDGHRVGTLALNAVARRNQGVNSAAGFDARRSWAPTDLTMAT